MKETRILPKEDINVGSSERLFSVIAGSSFMINALNKGINIPKAAVAGYLLFRGITGFCPAYKALSENTAEMKGKNVNIKTTVTVKKPRNEVYDFWRQLDNLPLFMKHLESVNILNDKTSEWKARIPGGIGTVDWKSEIVKDEQNERIGWRSLPGSNIENAGNVHFRDSEDSGTEVHAVISYRIPGGTAGKSVGKLFTPLFDEMIREDIKNFKHHIES